MLKQSTDLVLVEEVKRGNKKAFSLLVARYQNKIANLLRRYLGVDDIPDVVQETFIKAYQSIALFRGDSAFYTWLYRIAVNCAKNYIVANKNKISGDISVEDVENIEEGAYIRNIESPESLFATSELKKRLLDIIENLPVELKMSIIYREIEGLDYEQIAEKMKVPIGTVRSRLSRAREMIEQKIKNYL